MRTVSLVLLVCAIIGFDLYVIAQYRRHADSETPDSPAAIDNEISYAELDDHYITVDDELEHGGEYFRPLQFAYDLPGIDSPQLLNVDQANLTDKSQVIGVEINGEAYAFSVKAMDLETHHIVNFIHQQVPVSVTYCPLADCVRVLTHEESGLIPLRMGGLNDNSMMVFLLDGLRYDQDSPGLPLTDLSYTRTTYRDWKQMHPRTKVFTEQSVLKVGLRM